jgi:hypothetical protein
MVDQWRDRESANALDSCSAVSSELLSRIEVTPIMEIKEQSGIVVADRVRVEEEEPLARAMLERFPFQIGWRQVEYRIAEPDLGSELPQSRRVAREAL